MDGRHSCVRSRYDVASPDSCLHLPSLSPGNNCAEWKVGGTPNQTLFKIKRFFRDHIGPFWDTQNMFYTWSLPPINYGKVSMGGVSFRISNFLPTLEQNNTFTFYFNDFCLKLPL